TVAFSPDSRLLATADGGSLHVFEARTGNVLRSGQESARALAFSPDGKRLAVAGDRVEVRTVGTWAVEASFDAGHPQAHVAFAPDSDRVTSTGTDGFVHVWQVGDQHEAARFALGTQSVPMWLTFSPDGQTV